MRKNYLLHCLLILFPILSFAQNGKGTIKGKVLSADSLPASFVPVGLKGTTIGTTTDAQGNYQFKAPAGQHTLLIQLVGHEPEEKQLEVKEGETTVVDDFTLRENSKELQEVTVEAARSRESEFAAKIPIKDIENSQVVNVVRKELLVEQQVTNTEDAMKNAVGVANIFPATGRNGDGGTYYSSRGFTTQISLQNGISGAVFSNPDGINIERIEVLKGPSATLYGSQLTSFGGAINLVTKKPYDTLGGSVSYTTGSWELQRVTADFNTPLNKSKTALFRVNGAYHYQNSFQDFGFTKRYSIAPTFIFKATDKLSFYVEAGFSNIQANTPWFYSNLSTATRAQDLRIDYFKYYFPGDLYNTTKSTNLLGEMRYKIGSKWLSRTIVSSSSNSNQGTLPYLYFVSDTTLQRLHQTIEGQTNRFNIQQNFSGDFNFLGMRHRALVGLDYFRSVSDPYYSSTRPGMLDTVSSIKPSNNYMNYSANKYANASQVISSASQARSNMMGAYVSDVVNITDLLILNFGLRFDRFENEGSYNPVTFVTSGNYQQNAVSPRAGLLYQIMKDRVSVFASYQNGFQNVTGVDFYGNQFKPQRSNQYEGGAKFALLNNRLNSTISFYNIAVTNQTVPDLEHPTFSLQDGTQISKGVEVDVNIMAAKGFNVNLGYAYNDSKFTKASASNEGLRPVQSGHPHMANLWASYTVQSGILKGVGLGAGGNYASEKYMTNTRNTKTNQVITFTAPAYTVVNATIFYNQPRYRIALNVNNIGDERYWIGWNNLVPQKPREIMLGLTYKF